MARLAGAVALLILGGLVGVALDRLYFVTVEQPMVQAEANARAAIALAHSAVLACDAVEGADAATVSEARRTLGKAEERLRAGAFAEAERLALEAIEHLDVRCPHPQLL